LKVKRLLVIMVLALVVLFGINQAAQADSIIFPYVAVQPGVYSFVTITNSGHDEFDTLTGYHLSYGYKAYPVANKKGCNHYDVSINATAADMLTFEVGGKVTDAGSFILFEGTPPVTSTGDPRMLGASNHVGFLVVEPIGNDLANERRDRCEVFGWADIIDTDANMNLSYSTQGLCVNSSTDPNFNTSKVGTNWYKFQWMPTTYVTTAWYILPLGARSAMTPASGGGIRMVLRANDGDHPGAFDRDEQFFSGEKITPIRCLGIVTTADLLQPGPIAATLNGGWLHAESWGSWTAPATDPDDPGGVYGQNDFLAYRIQSATAAAGLGTRQTVNAEPQLDPAYDITLDVGP
jgi:hypothetical protein